MRQPALAFLLLMVAAAPIVAQQLFDEPVRLKADGAFIDAGKDIGYAGPLVRDHDKDGLPDLLLTSIRGNVRYFRNVGTRQEPVFEEKDPPQAEGQPLCFENW